MWLVMTKEDKKPVILWISDSPFVPTGYGQQTDIITKELALRGFEIHIIGHQHAGITIEDQYGRKIYGGFGTKFSEGTFDSRIKEINPDIVFCLSDWWMTSYLVWKQRHSDWALIQWLPMDGEPYDGSIKWSEGFLGADMIIMLSEFGFNQMEEGIDYANKHLRKGAHTTTPRLEWCYHAIDTDTFYPIEDEQVIKDTKKKYKISENAKVYLIVARNQPRKGFPVLLKAWADFITKNNFTSEDVVLWIHALKNDVGWDLGFLKHQIYVNPRRKKLNKENFHDTIRFTPDINSLNDFVSPDELNKIYNMGEVFVLPTVGEGFGLPTVETQACGTAPIITNCTTSPELLDEEAIKGVRKRPTKLVFAPNGILFPWIVEYTHKGNMDRFYPDRKGLVKALQYAHEHPEEMKQMGKTGVNWVSKNCTIKIITDKMEDILMRFWDYWKDRPLSKYRKRYGESYDEKRYGQVIQRNALSMVATTEKKKLIDMMPMHTNTILEVGCGSGELLTYFNREGFEALGCDISINMIGQCKSRGLTATYGDISELDNVYEGLPIDFVFASHILEHIEDWKEAIDSMWGRAEKGIGLTLPFDNMRDLSHIRVYLDEEIDELMDYLKSKPDCLYANKRTVFGGQLIQASYLIVAEKGYIK